MLFKDTKAGYPIYLLDREAVKAYSGKVVSVSAPRLQTPPIGATSPISFAGQMVVDVTIEADGTTRTYSIPEVSAITYAGSLVLSTDKDGILREVEAIKNQSEEALASVEMHKAKIEKCDCVLKEWNPAFAERAKQEERISGIEDKVDGLGKMLRDFIDEFRR